MKKVKSISTKRLTKDLTIKFSIFNEAKVFFYRNISKLFTIHTRQKNIKYFSGTTGIDLWKSIGMSEENIENITKSDTSFAQTFVDHHDVLLDIILIYTV